ncbi:MAG: N-acetyl-gamma-glutamyl-phosphate reductase [Deltaproteobacteria bacterium]|nr:N-acetyl-gamma-glutamyl-phosphate reductase [Deltaproteobacteria bacterium]
MTSKQVSIAVIGATGYTGVELVRLLQEHPQVKITHLTSESFAGKKFSECFPAFSGRVDTTLSPLDVDKMAKDLDLAFLCVPHQEAAKTVKLFLDKKVKVIDLSADFRLNDVKTYEAWYGPHPHPELLEKAIYGMPELQLSNLKNAELIANPGCYPTACLLAIAPLAHHKLIHLDSLIFDAKSGVSGAGRKLALGSHFCEVNENFKAYGIGKHRHTPEINQGIKKLTGQLPSITFTPHLVPMTRGILATVYAQLKSSSTHQDLLKIYQDYYQKASFVRLRPEGNFPETREVRNSNFCDIGFHLDTQNQRLTVVSAIDNLIKGASGQAIQNMNLMFGLEETCGLLQTSPIP